jgi:phospholipid/cholesterol/gamma-HCH transport system permease protein
VILAAARATGRSARHFLIEAGALWKVAFISFDRIVIAPLRGEPMRMGATVAQMARSGAGSLPLVALISTLVGMILALQSVYQLQKMGAESLVADLVAIAVTREMAPLLTAIIVSGRYGAAIAAEIGTMKVSQEVDALTVMGVDPYSFLVAPRLAALLITLPCLVIFADLVGILGGMLVAMVTMGQSAASYATDSIAALELRDIFTGLIKAVAFAGIIGLVGCRLGMAVSGGADEVGRATTSTVVRSIVLIIVTDLFVTAVTYVRS